MTAATGAGASGHAIRTEDLRKTYKSSRGDVPAVRGIDLSVGSGQFFGLLGPNGAGKSTTIGMLTTLIRPTGGRARGSGLDVGAGPVGGQARRLLIARALVPRPDVLFLDEPTAGLDPQTRVNLWDILQVLHAEGQTILLTTHYMEEAEALCEQVAVMDHGEVLASGTVNELKDGAGAETVITVRYEDIVPEGLAARTGLADRPGVSKVEADGDSVRVFTREPEGVLGELVTAGSAAGLTVRDATQLKPSLETVFLTLTGREYRE